MLDAGTCKHHSQFVAACCAHPCRVLVLLSAAAKTRRLQSGGHNPETAAALGGWEIVVTGIQTSNYQTNQSRRHARAARDVASLIPPFYSIAFASGRRC